jgi:hypothetical protein
VAPRLAQLVRCLDILDLLLELIKALVELVHLIVHLKAKDFASRF